MVFENSNRPLIHTLWNVFSARTTCSSPLPYTFLASDNLFFASLHSSLNHGASIFPHLLGFFGTINLISFTTFAFTACFSIYSSTAAALWSLLLLVLLIISCNSYINSGIRVYSCHEFAEFAYVYTPEPFIHLYSTCGLFMNDITCFLWKYAVLIFVVTSVWSDNFFNIVGSHSIPSVAILDKIISMHDLSFPRWNVWHAIGPG